MHQKHYEETCNKFREILNPRYYFDKISPVVTVEENFDYLYIPPHSNLRSSREVFYLDNNLMLRNHLAAHITKFLIEGNTSFLLFGEVYKKSEISSCEFPVSNHLTMVQLSHDPDSYVEKIVSSILSKLWKEDRKIVSSKMHYLSQAVSFHGKINDKLLKIIDYGILRDDFLTFCGLEGERGWFIDIHVDLWTMFLNRINDIRELWHD